MKESIRNINSFLMGFIYVLHSVHLGNIPLVNAVIDLINGTSLLYATLLENSHFQFNPEYRNLIHMSSDRLEMFRLELAQPEGRFSVVNNSYLQSGTGVPFLA
jgi:hypothetical protein